MRGLSLTQVRRARKSKCLLADKACTKRAESNGTLSTSLTCADRRTRPACGGRSLRAGHSHRRGRARGNPNDGSGVSWHTVETRVRLRLEERLRHGEGRSEGREVHALRWHDRVLLLERVCRLWRGTVHAAHAAVERVVRAEAHARHVTAPHRASAEIAGPAAAHGAADDALRLGTDGGFLHHRHHLRGALVKRHLLVGRERGVCCRRQKRQGKPGAERDAKYAQR